MLKGPLSLSLFAVALLTISGCRLGIRSATEQTSSPTSSNALVTPTTPWITDQIVHTMVTKGNKLFIGGEFNYIGPNTGGAAILSVTDGTLASQSFSSGAHFINGESINAMVSDGSGGYYVGGSFSSFNGVARNNLVRINSAGVVDTTFNPNCDGAVFSLLIEGGKLIVGGIFSNLGGAARANLGSVDLTSGNASTWDPSPDGTVRAMALKGDGNLYIGGEFTMVNMTSAPLIRNYLAEVDLTSGIASTWTPDPDNQVKTLKIIGTDLYVGGAFANIATLPRTKIAKFVIATGALTGFAPSIPGFGADVKAISSDSLGNTIYIGGSFITVNGQARNKFAAVDSVAGGLLPLDPAISGFYVNVIQPSADDNTIYIGGNFTQIGADIRRYIGAVDAGTGIATSWNPGGTDQVNLIQFVGSDILIAGSFISTGGKVRNHAAAIDIATGAATDWNPNTDGAVFAMAIDDDEVFLGGNFSNLGVTPRSYLAAVDQVNGAVTAFDPSPDNQIGSLAVSGSTLYVGGFFSTIAGVGRNHLAAIDLTTQTATAWNPNLTGWNVYTINVQANSVYIGGSFTNVGVSARNYLAEIDRTTGLATAWNPNPDSPVNDILVDGSTVYIAGGFSVAGGAGRLGFAAISATTGLATGWNANFDNSVQKLHLYDGKLVAVGFFNNAGGSSRNRIAEFDLTTNLLTGFDPNLDNDAAASLIYGDTLFIGGQFSAIGTKYPYHMGAIDLTTGLGL